MSHLWLPLSDRQMAVLRWIAGGCPDGVMTGFTYKTTAVALQNRRLATVSKRGGVWRAELTDIGRHYLANGTYPDPPTRQANKARVARPRILRPAPSEVTSPPLPAVETAQPAKSMTPTEELVAAVVAAGGRLTVQRSRTGRNDYDYEHLIQMAHRHGKVPAGKRLTSKTLPWPDMQIRLEDAIPGTEVPLRPVPVPEKVSRYHPVVVRFRDDPDRHEVSKPLLPRALRLLHALVTEAEQRGHQVTNVTVVSNAYGYSRWTGSRDGHISVAVNGTACALRLLELRMPSRAHWQQTHYASRERYPDKGSGNLSTEICSYSREARQAKWADRKSWTLDDKLPEILREIEVRAAEDEHRRLEAERAAAERRRRWEAAVAEAKVALVEARRAEHLHEQAKHWRQAQRLREYLTAMKDTIDVMHGEDIRAAEEWIAWAEAYVARFDPLARRLAMPELPEAKPEDLQPFLAGWSPYGPESSRRGW